MQIDLAPDLSLLAIMVIFILNYLVVRRYFLRPINQVLEERETESRGAEAVYEEALARFNEATSRTEMQLHDAKRTAAQLREQFRGQAAAHRQAVLDRTNAEAREVIAVADQKLQKDVETARTTIVRDSEALARMAAERILGRAV